ncbi:DUF4886 domain-containing protein [Spirosoma endophyticum]|uniref:DUF4886 domain-containing protein n=1 Tax=Spirosoma endophyticum TaxID=662367 RepID=A0A1I1W6I5_9BACT|nr:DUF4886 domain-containing protein [Spirosoma endophyticum]SFD90836.1 protein of unknown function [Spirosoma endophyticum]
MIIFRRFSQNTFLLFLILFTVEGVFGQSEVTGANDGKPALHLFMIGNSFSQNASKYLPQLSKEGGHELIIGRAELGGSSLQRHWDHAEAAERNPDDPNGKPYGGKSLKMLLSEGVWDVVTIQQASILSGDVETYRPYARKLYEYVRKLQPKTTIVFHQTWAYRTDSKDFSQIATKDSAKSAQEMWEKSRAAYHTIADELSIPIIPNGDAFWQINSTAKWAYRKDDTFNFSQSQAPNLPNQTHSLHMGYRWDKGKLAFDSHHANAAGCYLGALVWYGFLFDESPVKLTFYPEEVDPNFAKQLRKTAWSTVKKEKKKSASMRAWVKKQV